MSLILCIESATTVCSVALFRDDVLLCCRELDNGYTHAENLHLFTGECLRSSAVKANEISAIAVSAGPGSYTGLRIGASAAKGLAFSLNIPMISIDTLQIMAAGAQQRNTGVDYFCPLIDARRMEVYTRVFNKELLAQNATRALIMDKDVFSEFPAVGTVAFFGDGMEKCRELLSSESRFSFIDGVVPSAKHMGSLAKSSISSGIFADIAYFEPLYMKEFNAGKKKTV